MSMLYGATGAPELTRMAQVIDSGRQQRHSGVRVVSLCRARVQASAPCHFICGFPMLIGALTADIVHRFGPSCRICVHHANTASGLGADYLIEQWQWMLIIMAVLSLAMATSWHRAIQSKRCRIDHVHGLLLLGILSGTRGYVGHVLCCGLRVDEPGTFGMILLSRAVSGHTLDDFKGLNQRSLWYAVVMLMLMFSMAGAPPMVGFVLSVLSAVIDAGYLWLAAAVLFR
jgi:NADH-quinone oxidoreductase subunit N